jgi:hypothetical protein
MVKFASKLKLTSLLCSQLSAGLEIKMLFPITKKGDNVLPNQVYHLGMGVEIDDGTIVK